MDRHTEDPHLKSPRDGQRADLAQLGALAGTPVMTLQGFRAIETLRPGDLVMTRAGARPLRALRTGGAPLAEAVTIRAGSLGHGRPARDIVLATDQPVLLRNAQAQTLRQEDVVQRPSRRIAPPTPLDGPEVAHILVFDEPEAVYTDGAELPMAGLSA